jgi:hypothetical protein
LESKKYDIGSIHGAEIFRDLPLGLIVTMQNGLVGEIIGNPHDGAVLQLRITEFPDDPSRVGDEEFIYFTEVREIRDP